MTPPSNPPGYAFPPANALAPEDVAVTRDGATTFGSTIVHRAVSPALLPATVLVVAFLALILDGAAVEFAWLRGHGRQDWGPQVATVVATALGLLWMGVGWRVRLVVGTHRLAWVGTMHTWRMPYADLAGHEVSPRTRLDRHDRLVPMVDGQLTLTPRARRKSWPAIPFRTHGALEARIVARLAQVSPATRVRVREQASAAERRRFVGAVVLLWGVAAVLVAALAVSPLASRFDRVPDVRELERVEGTLVATTACRRESIEAVFESQRATIQQGATRRIVHLPCLPIEVSTAEGLPHTVSLLLDPLWRFGDPVYELVVDGRTVRDVATSTARATVTRDTYLGTLALAYGVVLVVTLLAHVAAWRERGGA